MLLNFAMLSSNSCRRVSSRHCARREVERKTSLLARQRAGATSRLCHLSTTKCLEIFAPPSEARRFRTLYASSSRWLVHAPRRENGNQYCNQDDELPLADDDADKEPAQHSRPLPSSWPVGLQSGPTTTSTTAIHCATLAIRRLAKMAVSAPYIVSALDAESGVRCADLISSGNSLRQATIPSVYEPRRNIWVVMDCFRLFLIYGASGNREMPPICVSTANPPRWSTRQHWHGSCSLLGIWGCPRCSNARAAAHLYKQMTSGIAAEGETGAL